MEQYGLDGLMASAEAVAAGLGPLAAGLARLAGEAGRAVTLEAMEGLVLEQGRELLRGVVQLALDGQAAAESRLPQVTGADGVRRGRAERGHARRVVTRLGEVVVRRIGYRSGVKGAGSLFPRDGLLNLPPCQYSWGLQRLAEMFARSGSYEQAREFVVAATGVQIGKRQLEWITIAAAADTERFGQDRPGQGAAGPGEELPALVLSADGKGVAMRPEARRRRTQAPGQRMRTFAHRTGTGEKKGHKRMAETGCVFDVAPPAPGQPPRTPEQIMRRAPGEPAPATPAAVNRWYACDITAGRDVTISKIFGEAERRDPGHQRRWIVLADGDVHQLGLFQAQAAARHVTVTIIIDFIHVLEYLWKAAWCFHTPRDPAAEDWVTAAGQDILAGRVDDVIARIAGLAAADPPRPGGEHARIIRKTLHYLAAKQPHLDYPAALANGWPIATGVIEGACRHLIADRMGITGARWGLPGAQAILWLRAIATSGDINTYWDWHITQEHQRNHQNHYQHSLQLAA